MALDTKKSIFPSFFRRHQSTIISNTSQDETMIIMVTLITSCRVQTLMSTRPKAPSSTSSAITSGACLWALPPPCTRCVYDVICHIALHDITPHGMTRQQVTQVTSHHITSHHNQPFLSPLLQSYRPLTVLTFRWNFMVHGLDPYGYHVVNSAVHAVVT